MGARFWNAAGKPVAIENLWQGAHLFITCGGPSLAKMRLKYLRHPGIMTMGCNNSPFTWRPDFWTMVDDVKNFSPNIYRDPRILKFLPHPKNKHRLWDNNEWQEMGIAPKDCPGVLYYKRASDGRKEWFKPETFFEQDIFTWGNHKQRCFCGEWREDKQKECKGCGRRDHFGSRTVFLVLLRLAYELGFRDVYLLGCDFKMSSGDQNYAWKQSRSRGSCKNNNNTYRILNDRMELLKPECDKRGLRIHNCTPDSGLRVFPYLDYREALWRAVEWMPEREQTDGLYDRKANKNKRPGSDSLVRLRSIGPPSGVTPQPDAPKPGGGPPPRTLVDFLRAKGVAL